jgi:hypothetical protein
VNVSRSPGRGVRAKKGVVSRWVLPSVGRKSTSKKASVARPGTLGRSPGANSESTADCTLKAAGALTPSAGFVMGSVAVPVAEAGTDGPAGLR